ncbi:centrosome-associated protein CEP250 isoform X3 [Penaeus vannamei]|uniref:centrosome-associated protein CEP250 isoform X3 n=1 Tax=Penaeus vannamei TaxID=6689 RepID=UPI00387F6C04
MCRTCGRRHNSIVQDGSPAQIQDVSLDSSGSSSIPFSLGLRSPGKVSPLRGRTMKEYEEQLGSLKKENFSLKLRIYFLEERMGQKYDKEDKEELYKTNIELKVETEALKRELYDKQELVRQASTALSGLEQQFQEQVAQMKGIHEQEKLQLNEKIGQLQKDLDDYDQRIQEEGGRQGELTKLCGLAFSTGAEEEEPADPVPSREKLSLPLNLQGHNNSSFGHSPVQGLFSLPATVPSTLGKIQSPNKPGELSEDPDLAEQKVAALEARVVELEERVTELEGELAAKEETNSVLEGDIANLRKELEDKVEKIADLEVEVSEKDMKIDDVMQELETRHVEIQAKEDQIEALHQDLIKVEPEIEVKVQEIVERDRIIEEKIEQIEQQNKILVEIQITLDEKQKQIADMEQKISDYSAKITKLNEELDKACKTIQTFAEEVEARDKEIVTLKKELKRKEKKIKDLVAELKEALDMLNKAKWEAETSGGEDGVKEMAEEENERLWAELESRKNEVLALRAEHKHSLSEAQDRISHLQQQLEEKLKALDGQKEKHSQDVEEREAKLRDLVQQVARLEGQLQALHGDMSNREGQLRTNQDLMQELKDELGAAKEELKEKKQELDNLQDELKKKNADMQDLVNCELWERNKEVEKLHEKLSALTSDHQKQISNLKEELQAKNNEINRLETKPLSENSKSSDVSHTSSCPVINTNLTVASSTNDQPKNAAHLTVVTNTGADLITVARPLHVTLGDDSAASVQLLYQEINKIRGEAQALRLERSILNDKLQKLNEKVSQTADVAKANELREQMDMVKRQLEESKEQNLQKDRQHGEVVSDFQSQVQTLRNELHNAKKKISRQLTEVSVRKYQESLKRHKQEIASLRKRLADSHNACDLLRTRLEELADFLERILEMDEKGLINLSQLSAKHIASLHKTLNESRALSRSLSQSLMIGMDTTDHGDDGLLSSCSLSSVSSWSLQRDDSLSETHDPVIASSHETLPNLPDETILQGDETHDPAFQAIATQLNTQIDQKTREIDAIAENVCVLSEQLAERTRQVEQQAGVIGELRGQVGRLQEEVRHRDLQLMASQADQDQDNNQANLHGSWHSSTNPLAASSQSTVHAASPQTTVNAQDYSSQERLRKSPSTCSDTLPPPPLHLLQDSECEDIRGDVRELEICQASDRSSLSAVKSAYSTDAAIKAYSRHPGYFHQLAPQKGLQSMDGRKSWVENASGPGGCIGPEQPWAPVSPSESEAWSEPDRNVSLARIGLDACTLVGGPDRALSRSRQQRASAAITSESDGEAAYEETTTCTANPISTPGKSSKRRSDIAELRRVSTKLRAVEQLNETLRAELNIYQTLSQQLVPQQQNQQERPKTSDKSVETHKGETVDASVGAEEEATLPAPPPPMPALAIPAPLLEEIRALRLKLEEAIANNDHLRDQLEAALTAHPQDEARFHHLTAALQIAQEEVREARDRLQCTQEALRAQQDLTNGVQQKCQDYERSLEKCKARLENSEAELKTTRAELTKAQQVVQEKEALILDQEKLLHQKDSQLSENEQIIVEIGEKIKYLEKNATESQENDVRVQELQTAMQKQETRLLEVNKERLSLVGERARLQAQLASMATQARLLKDDKQEIEEVDSERVSLLKQLEAGQTAAMAMYHEKQQLLKSKEHLEKEVMILQEEIASLRAKANHLAAREAHAAHISDSEQRGMNELRTAHTKLQQAYRNLQEYNQKLGQELSALKERKKVSEQAEARTVESERLVKQLTAQLESERCLTTNLQLQLDALRSKASPASSHNDSVVPNASDLASPESVTSIEFFRPSSDISSIGLRGRRPASLGPSSPTEKEKSYERRASSSSRRRDSSKRYSSHWSEDKENLHTTTTTITTTTTSSKRGRRLQSNSSNDGVLAEQAAPPQLPNIHHEEENDGGTTSGESPDLGIGSDYHFSSLERGTHIMRSTLHANSDLPLRPLCSEPSHSTLSVENQQLRQERDNLSEKLASTKDTLKDALEKLSRANQRKESVERAICKQLTKTHHVLKKAKGNLKQANSLPQ